MGPSVSQLYLAYRQAKAALYFEHRGTGLIELAQYERNLPANLSRLQAKLSGGRGWFDAVDVGEVWIVPKGLRPRDQDDSVIHIGTLKPDTREADIDVQIRLSPTPDFAVVEVLYLWMFGPALETQLTRNSVGYRLDLQKGRLLKTRRGLFEFWPKRYQEFRTAPLRLARRELTCGAGSVVVMSADLASFYDTIDPYFLIRDSFVEQITTTAQQAGIAFDTAEYLAATNSLLSAYERFRQFAAARTGLDWSTGIPIGALTSRVIANVALAPLDRHIEAQPDTLCYRRYVDDFVVVMRTGDAHVELSDILQKYLPLESVGNEKVKLNTAALDRAGSDFHLQLKKVRVHHLSGTQGKDFLDAVAADFTRVVSEGRAFFDTAVIRGDGVSHLIRAGADESSPLRVLRKADRVHLERFALSTSLRSLEKVSELVDHNQARKLVRRTLSRVVRVLDAEDNWIDNLDLSIRLLRLAILAEDWDSCRELIARMDAFWGTVDSLKESLSRLFHRNRPIDRDRVAPWVGLRNYLHARTLECVCCTLRLSAEPPDLRDWLPAGLRVGTKLLQVVALRRRAIDLAAADLRTRNREADTDARGVPGSFDLYWMIELLQDDPDLTRRLLRIRDYIVLCLILGDTPWRMPPARLFLCTRPPSYFDIARRWLYRTETRGFDSSIFDELLAVVNAVRGTEYRDPVGNVIDEQTVLIPWEDDGDESNGGNAEDPRLILGNLVLREEYWTRAATRVPGSTVGKPSLDIPRLSGLSLVLEKAAAAATEGRPPTRKFRPSLLVLPELSLPRQWFKSVAEHVVRHGRYGLVVGLEYRHDFALPHVRNQVFAVLPGPFSSVATWPWTKRLPAREEAACLASLPTPVSFPPPSARALAPRRTVVRSPWGNFSVLICSELIEARQVADLLGRVELVICPAWNRDTSSYDHLIQSVGLQLHAIIAIANNGHYSDCTAWAPYVERWERDLCRLIERDVNDVVHKDLPIMDLMTFHASKGLPVCVSAHGTKKTWKPLPPDWP